MVAVNMPPRGNMMAWWPLLYKLFHPQAARRDNLLGHEEEIARLYRQRERAVERLQHEIEEYGRQFMELAEKLRDENYWYR